MPTCSSELASASSASMPSLAEAGWSCAAAAALGSSDWPRAALLGRISGAAAAFGTVYRLSCRPDAGSHALRAEHAVLSQNLLLHDRHGREHHFRHSSNLQPESITFNLLQQNQIIQMYSLHCGNPDPESVPPLCTAYTMTAGVSEGESHSLPDSAITTSCYQSSAF